MGKAFSGNIISLLDMLQTRLSKVAQECHITCMLQDRSWTPVPGGSKLCPLSTVPAFKMLEGNVIRCRWSWAGSMSAFHPFKCLGRTRLCDTSPLKNCLVEYNLYMVLLFKKLNISLTFIVS